eukprot:CAMPEP_0198216134 /NCGR_PEP_ID=MMETSP1445-20131203/55140_1 /TAXON_ID=36898 /ORGANISM="Pyramimonas sp., Strain CCMP2087" /LENGTH=285 /DNA_ID=CAMNT_0043892227 /DNA_START=154 /DNA_END=1010 /DNA_ORIENTATION=+
MGKHRVKPVYFLPILLRAHGESNPEKHIELSIAGVREKDKIATIKDLIEIKYEIPRDHQTLRGPLPSKKILLDSKSLRRSRIVLGRVILPGAKRMDPRLHGSDEEDEDESTLVSAEPPSLVTDAASTSGRSMPGLLFSTGGPFLEGRGKTIRMGDEGSAGMGTTVDLIELITRHPPAHYSQGGDYYEAAAEATKVTIFRAGTAGDPPDVCGSVLVVDYTVLQAACAAALDGGRGDQVQAGDAECSPQAGGSGPGPVWDLGGQQRQSGRRGTGVAALIFIRAPDKF